MGRHTKQKNGTTHCHTSPTLQITSSGARSVRVLLTITHAKATRFLCNRRILDAAKSKGHEENYAVWTDSEEEDACLEEMVARCRLRGPGRRRFGRMTTWRPPCRHLFRAPRLPAQHRRSSCELEQRQQGDEAEVRAVARCPDAQSRAAPPPVISSVQFYVCWLPGDSVSRSLDVHVQTQDPCCITGTSSLANCVCTQRHTMRTLHCNMRRC